MLRTIDSADDVPGFLENMITNKQKIMGLGHRVYRVKDPRATVLQGMAADLFDSHGSTPLYDIAHKLEQEAAKAAWGEGHLPQRRFLQWSCLREVGHRGGSVHASVCDFPRGWLDSALVGAVGRQPHLPTDAVVCRFSGRSLCVYRV